MKRFELILLVITIGLAFFLGYCNSRVIEIPYDVVTTDTITTVRVDTVEIEKIVEVKIEYPVYIEVDTVKSYDTIVHKDNYYNLKFKEDDWTVSTYGGFVDSVEVDGIVKENTITKTITNTVTNTIEKNSLYVDLGINYSPEYSLFPQAGLVYTRKGFGYGLGGGYIFDKDEQDSWFIGGKLLIRLR